MGLEHGTGGTVDLPGLREGETMIDHRSQPRTPEGGEGAGSTMSEDMVRIRFVETKEFHERTRLVRTLEVEASGTTVLASGVRDVASALWDHLRSRDVGLDGVPAKDE